MKYYHLQEHFQNIEKYSYIKIGLKKFNTTELENILPQIKNIYN